MRKIVLLITLILSALMISSHSYTQASEIVGPSVIHKQSNHILTISNILRLYSSTYGNVTVQSDEYTGYGNILGLHQVVLKVTSGDDVYLKNVNVYVVSELGNVKAVTDYKDIHVRTDQQLTPNHIVDILQNTGYIQITASTQMMITNDTYSLNKATEGQYIFEFRLINSAGHDETYTSLINVSDTDGFFVPDVIFEPPVTGLQKAWKWVVRYIWPVIYGFISILVFGLAFIVLYRIAKKRKG